MRLATPDFPRLMNIGRMDANKNHEFLLRDFHRVRQVARRQLADHRGG